MRPHVEVHNLTLQQVLEHTCDHNPIQAGSRWIKSKTQGEALDEDWHGSSQMNGVDHSLDCRFNSSTINTPTFVIVGFIFPTSETLECYSFESYM